MMITHQCGRTVKNPTQPPPSAARVEQPTRPGKVQSVCFHQLKCELLSNHDIADRHSSSRKKAEPTRPSSGRIQFLNVHLGPRFDAVPFSGLAASDFEIPVSAVLSPLIRGKNFAQQLQRKLIRIGSWPQPASESGCKM